MVRIIQPCKKDGPQFKANDCQTSRHYHINTWSQRKSALHYTNVGYCEARLQIGIVLTDYTRLYKQNGVLLFTETCS